MASDGDEFALTIADEVDTEHEDDSAASKEGASRKTEGSSVTVTLGVVSSTDESASRQERDDYSGSVKESERPTSKAQAAPIVKSPVIRIPTVSSAATITKQQAQPSFVAVTIAPSPLVKVAIATSTPQAVSPVTAANKTLVSPSSGAKTHIITTPVAVTSKPAGIHQGLPAVHFVPVPSSATSVRTTGLLPKGPQGTFVRTDPHSAVRITLVQATTAATTPSATIGSPRPVTITTTQALRQISPTATQPPVQRPITVSPDVMTLRIPQPRPSGDNTTVTMIPPIGGQSVSVTLNPPSGGGHQVARVVAPQSGARLISIPASTAASIVTGGVLPKAVSVPVVTRTISLPQGSNPIPVQKVGGGQIGIPIARVIPQPLASPLHQSRATPASINIVPVPAAGIRPLEKSGTVNLVSTLKAGAEAQQQQSPTTVFLGAPITVSSQNELSSKAHSSSRPGILRRREGERESNVAEIGTHSIVCPDSRGDEASSSGSTTLSATSSPCDNANFSGDEASLSQPSPRKKPRKQHLGNVREQCWSEEDVGQPPVAETTPATVGATAAAPSGAASAVQYRRRPRVSLLNSYRHTWRSRHNHFMRYSDVKRKDERKPTVNDLASEPFIMQKINGWKLHYVSSQMEEILNIETDFNSTLNSLLKRLDAAACKDLTKDVNKVHEIIKANIQRSKIIQDQVRESKDHSMNLFDHKSRVQDILSKYASRRQVKKRER